MSWVRFAIDPSRLVSELRTRYSELVFISELRTHYSELAKVLVLASSVGREEAPVPDTSSSVVPGIGGSSP